MTGFLKVARTFIGHAEKQSLITWQKNIQTSFNPMNKDNYQGFKEAFLKLHTKWLNANHRMDMNKEMDELAIALGLNPLTLEASSATKNNLTP
jgi:hypothetical protein